ncbi:MAG: T9SS type A sorting domain-containing protein [Chlorobiota bacterium]
MNILGYFVNLKNYTLRLTGIKVFLILLTAQYLHSQTLPTERSIDWTLAGIRDTNTIGFEVYDMNNLGAIGDGESPNDEALNSILTSLNGKGAIIKFPSGNFLFNKTINLPSNVVVSGKGADNTTLTFDLGGKGHSITASGKSNKADTTYIINTAKKDDSILVVNDNSLFSEGDWIQIIQNDSNLVTSSWSIHSVGQVVKIKRIEANTLTLDSPLRMDYDIEREPFIQKITPVENIGIECVKIVRIDDTAPQQTSNIYFGYAVNSWVKCVESENCTFSHIQANNSSNLSISKSYMHHGFDYGGGGRAYGVMLHSTTNESLVEDNIFERLRHSMIVQSGANGNVFAYNYSLDAYWDSFPNDAAGDAVLHGNFPYANLFEQNICQNIVIDNSHGPNGPNNTIFRNRAEKFGIFFSASNSPNQNLIGNEIPNTSLPYNIVNYTIQGEDHFVYGNNNKGNITPSNTSELLDKSYAYAAKPDYIPSEQWAMIGTPNDMESATIPAYDRYESGQMTCGDCGTTTSVIEDSSENYGDFKSYPNPISNQLTIESKPQIKNIIITNTLGQIIYTNDNRTNNRVINTDSWESGVYIITIRYIDGSFSYRIVVKSI